MQREAIVDYEKMNKIIKVPGQFRFKDPNRYPIDNEFDFEYWLTLNFKEQDIPNGWTYLPITWTAYYKTCNYGINKRKIQVLQLFLNRLDKSKKYFSIIQWDDGILNSIKHLNIKVFAMGSVGDYPLPLICQPHKYEFPGIKKDILCSYVGTPTHPIRKEIVKQLTGVEGFYISEKKHSLEEYCKIIARSKYVLAPRGYGKTSFRIMESLQYGAIPVYLSDIFIYPHNITDICFHLTENYIKELPTLLSEKEIPDYSPKEIFNKYFTYETNKKLIIENLKS